MNQSTFHIPTGTVDGFLYQNGNIFRVWFWLMDRASQRLPGRTVDGKWVTISPDEWVFTQREASRETGLSTQEYKTAMKKLIAEKYIEDIPTELSTKRYTKVSILELRGNSDIEANKQPNL